MMMMSFKESEMIPDKIDGLEVHKPLDAILEEKQPGLQLPPYAVATELLRDPILNALADNLQGIRNAEQLRTNQATLTIAVQQAAASQGISQDQLEQILRRVSEHHGEGLAQQLLARLGPGPPPPPAGAAAERVSFGTDPMMQDAAVGGDGPIMRDRSVEARRTTRDASTEAGRSMRDAGADARCESPVDATGGGGPPTSTTLDGVAADPPHWYVLHGTEPGELRAPAAGTWWPGRSTLRAACPYVHGSSTPAATAVGRLCHHDPRRPAPTARR